LPKPNLAPSELLQPCNDAGSDPIINVTPQTIRHLSIGAFINI